MKKIVAVLVGILLLASPAFGFGGLGSAGGGGLSLNALPRTSTLAQSRGNRKIVIFGDSRTDQNTVPSISTASATEYSKMAQGWIGWLQALTNQRFDFDLGDNYGKSGDTSAQMLARIPAALAATTAKVAIVLIGTNDANSSVPFATTKANVDASIALLQAAGMTVIVIAELPRGDGTNTSARLTATNLKHFLQYAEYLRRLKTTPGVFVADPWQYWADPLSTTGDVVSPTYTKDGLHEAPIGAYYIALALVPIVNAIFPPVDILPTANSDLFDATDNPWGCLNSNPMMDGTAGTFNATGGSGVVATGWSENAGPTWTRVYSKATLANGKPAQQVVLGGTGTTSGVGFRQIITAGNLTIGDQVQAVASVEIDASAANTSQLALQLLDNNTITSGDMRRTLTTETIPNIASQIRVILRTPVYTLTSTTLQLQFFMNVLNAVTPAATIRMGQVCLRKVASNDNTPAFMDRQVA